jgi:hypothetical protein
LWLSNDDLQDSSSWSSPPLLLLLDIRSKSSGVQLVQTDRGQFHFCRVAFSSHLKSRASNILVKTVHLLIMLNLDEDPTVSDHQILKNSNPLCARTDDTFVTNGSARIARLISSICTDSVVSSRDNDASKYILNISISLNVVLPNYLITMTAHKPLD